MPVGVDGWSKLTRNARSMSGRGGEIVLRTFSVALVQTVRLAEERAAGGLASNFHPPGIAMPLRRHCRRLRSTRPTSRFDVRIGWPVPETTRATPTAGERHRSHSGAVAPVPSGHEVPRENIGRRPTSTDRHVRSERRRSAPGTDPRRVGTPESGLATTDVGGRLRPVQGSLPAVGSRERGGCFAAVAPLVLDFCGLRCHPALGAG